jgi:chaperonin cofactor prefoldin
MAAPSPSLEFLESELKSLQTRYDVLEKAIEQSNIQTYNTAIHCSQLASARTEDTWTGAVDPTMRLMIARMSNECADCELFRIQKSSLERQINEVREDISELEGEQADEEHKQKQKK